ncbi:hypothetical protein DPMN_183294 [Dreissena polymorpha]|uniref:Uncharacterized protein n=1 Tax=Dreissena polymorpha TaxID=45954 RepID=A0A9D4I684_DREPO|nr:hypothetical protein DPMN_183294 [Dreissena polymorpha]
MLSITLSARGYGDPCGSRRTGQTVRTNNDVEGWHRRINTRAGRADLGFYMLVPLIRMRRRQWT